MGTTPLETARIEMWDRRMEQLIFGPIGQVGQHVIPYFANIIEQMPVYAESQRKVLDENWAWLDNELADGRTWLVDDKLSIADITGRAALMVCDFMQATIPDDLEHARRWESQRAKRSLGQCRTWIPDRQ